MSYQSCIYVIKIKLWNHYQMSNQLHWLSIFTTFLSVSTTMTISVSLSTSSSPKKQPSNETRKTTSINRAAKNFCAIPYPEQMFLMYALEFSSCHLYVLYEHFRWRLSLNGNKIPKQPEEVRTLLPWRLSIVTYCFQNTFLFFLCL